MVSASILMILLVVSGAHAARDCAAPVTNADLDGVLAEAEAGFGAKDKDRVVAAADRAEAVLPCLDRLVEPTTAARFFRVEGYRAFLDKDQETAALDFAAARAADPTYVLPAEMVPEGHPLRVLFDGAASTGDVELLVAPAKGTLAFDGVIGDQRPVDRPTLFQHVRGKGAAELTALLRPGDPVPDYGAVNPPVVAVAAPVLESVPATARVEPLPAATAVQPKGEARGPRRGLLYTAAGSLVASGACYGAALATRSAYMDTEVVSDNRDRLESLYGTNRTLFVAAGVTAGAGIALGAGAYLVGRW